jgi:hypothetical protein
MIAIRRNQINPIKMATSPPKEVVNCGIKVINTDGFIYDYVGIGWVKCIEATNKDYLEIPKLTD